MPFGNEDPGACVELKATEPGQLSVAVGGVQLATPVQSPDAVEMTIGPGQPTIVGGVTSTLAIHGSRPATPSVAAKTNLAPNDVNPAGADDPAPAVMSATRCVPARVPSVAQTSVPDDPSDALKTACPEQPPVRTRISDGVAFATPEL